MTLAQRLGKWYQFRFKNLTLSVPSTYITNTGILHLLFKDKDEYEMKNVDGPTGRVFVDYVMSHTYEVDYETAEQDEDVALREYKIALKVWAIGRMYNIHGLVVLARDHAVKLAEFMNPVSALVATVDTPLVMKHITGIIHRIDDYTEEFLQSVTRQEATELLLCVQPPQTVGWLWATLQLMLKAQGPALERGWCLVHQTLPILLPKLRECLLLLEEMRRLIREREHMVPEEIDPFDEEVVRYFLTPFNHWIPDAKIKCGKVMRAMVGSFNSSQKIGTRNKEKPPERDKYFFTIHSISSDHLEDDKRATSSFKHEDQHLISDETTFVDAYEHAPVCPPRWVEVPKLKAFEQHDQCDSLTDRCQACIDQLTPGSSQNSPEDEAAVNW